MRERRTTRRFDLLLLTFLALFVCFMFACSSSFMILYE